MQGHNLKFADHKRAARHAGQPRTVSVRESLDGFVSASDWNSIGFDDWQGFYYSKRGQWTQVNQRDRGSFSPVYLTQQDLDMLRARCRVVAACNVVGDSALERLTDYVIATGYTFTATGESDNDLASTLAARVQRVVEEWLDDNDFLGDLDREIFIRSRRDGECFVRYVDKPDRLLLRCIEPDYIRDTGQAGEDADFGVLTAPNDIEDVRGYWVEWEPGAGEFLPVGEVEHIKCNVDRNVKRGVSDFYPVLGWLNDAEKLLRNTSQGSALQAAIAWVEEYAAGVTQVSAESMRSTAASGTFTQPTQSGGRTQYAREFGPGTVLKTSQGRQYKPGPLGSERSQNFVLVEQAVLRMIGAKWSMPEYMISGDASNANFASTMVAESPFVRRVQALQTIYRGKFLRMAWRAVRHAYSHGAFNGYGIGSYGELESLVKIDATPPQVEVRDPVKEAQVKQIELLAGVESVQGWSAAKGYDYEQKQRERVEYQDQYGYAMPSADMPTPSIGGDVPTADALANPIGGDVSTYNIADKVLNGAQMAQAVQIAVLTASGQLPRDTALGQLQVLFGLSSEQAASVLGSAGTNAATVANPGVGKVDPVSAPTGGGE